MTYTASGGVLLPITAAPALPASALVLIAARLGVSLDDLDQFVLGFEYGFVASQVVAQWPLIGDPAALEWPDSDFFTRACALIVAARLFGPLTTGVNGILVKQQSADGDSETYMAPPAASPEKWLEEAQAALGLISCIKNALSARAASFRTFRVSGPTRTAAATGYPSTILGGLAMLLDTSLYPLSEGEGL